MKIICLIIVFLLGLPAVTDVMGAPSTDVYLSSSNIPQGDLCLIRVGVENQETPQMTWMKKKIGLVPKPNQTGMDFYLPISKQTREHITR